MLAAVNPSSFPKHKNQLSAAPNGKGMCTHAFRWIDIQWFGFKDLSSKSLMITYTSKYIK